jgi:hypothetical protein
MVAYTGATIDFPWWGKVVFDLAGMRLDSKLPALREHARDRVVGVINESTKEQSTLRAQGYFAGTPDGREVANLIREGFPYQASVGVWPSEVEELKEGASAQVNGGVFRGPGVIVRQSHVREISFVALGADPQTSVAALAASAGGGGLPANEPPADFQTGVKLMMRARGLPVRLAIKAAAAAWPGLWRGYLAAVPDPEGVEAACGLAPPVSDPFLHKIQALMDAGKSRVEALKAAVRDFPELHTEYLDRANETP